MTEAQQLKLYKALYASAVAQIEILTQAVREATEPKPINISVSGSPFSAMHETISKMTAQIVTEMQRQQARQKTDSEPTYQIPASVLNRIVSAFPKEGGLETYNGVLQWLATNLPRLLKQDKEAAESGFTYQELLRLITMRDEEIKRLRAETETLRGEKEQIRQLLDPSNYLPVRQAQEWKRKLDSANHVIAQQLAKIGLLESSLARHGISMKNEMPRIPLVGELNPATLANQLEQETREHGIHRGDVEAMLVKILPPLVQDKARLDWLDTFLAAEEYNAVQMNNESGGRAWLDTKLESK